MMGDENSPLYPKALCHADGELVCLWDDDKVYRCVFTDRDDVPVPNDLDIDPGATWVPIYLLAPGKAALLAPFPNPDYAGA